MLIKDFRQEVIQEVLVASQAHAPCQNELQYFERCSQPPSASIAIWQALGQSLQLGFSAKVQPHQ